MPSDQIGPSGYSPSIVSLLEEKDLIEEDVQKLIRLKSSLGGRDEAQSSEFTKLLAQVKNRLSTAIGKAEIVGRTEGTQYETGKALILTLKSLEAELAGLSRNMHDKSAEGLDNSVLTANSAFLEVIFVLSGLVFLLILCSTSAVSKDITVVEMLFVICILCVAAYYIYSYLFFNTSWLS